MNERPILFSAPMVRAILNGTKTQTRRALNPQPDVTLDYTKGRSVQRLRCVGLVPDGKKGLPWWQAEDERGPINAFRSWRDSIKAEIGCPYGQPGDLLWVRETWGEMVWKTIIGNPAPPRTEIVYLAGPHPFDRDVPHGWGAANRWKPSIHMPRSFSRLSLEVTGVRVERVQDISRADAKAEGFLPGANGLESWGGQCYGNAQLAYRACWDSLNDKRGHGWDVNPWVWVIEFQRVAA